MNELISAWRQLSLEAPPFVLPEDLAVLGSSGRYAVTFRSYEEYAKTGLEKPDDPRFHFGLLPEPYFGDVANATVFVLLLNPGLGSADYYAEHRDATFRQAVIANLRQENNRKFPLFFLDPLFAWHPGGTYVRQRLHWLALAISRQKKLAYFEALALLAKEICWLQLVPYHSPSYRLPDGILKKLKSTKLMTAFVRSHVLPRTDGLVIVTRKAAKWGLPDHPHILKYVGSEARAAYLSPISRGGQALAKHFGVTADQTALKSASAPAL